MAAEYRENPFFHIAAGHLLMFLASVYNNTLYAFILLKQAHAIANIFTYCAVRTL